ncbi:putative membrane protein [Streptococcus pneumoniae SPAR95]|nr:hypothetical protein SPND219_00191 [Streptococcus pneumoniae]EGI87925.1 putative membrane protein [Streptococcus pneumoniae GA41301]EHE06621.1 putative membrane protein [Streptococcus pneumoniae GA17227]EHE46856.1 putative membrane protein [Streptococcus pneumoniae GA47976]EHZ06936.1 putative membrane protein [Streptococcus pneumoniae GA05245]EHZ25283.1 putative membrane protein [Streptococcus pneumoniae GA13723]EJG83583.1 putative membrane protein [Streptococcus pneumoniae SPAR95]
MKSSILSKMGDFSVRYRNLVGTVLFGVVLIAILRLVF